MNVMGCFHRLCYSRLVSLWFVTILRTTDGSSITWYEPPPVETIADNSVITSVKRNITKGSINEELSWNFSLTADLNPLILLALKLDNVQVGTIAPTVPSVSVISGWEHRFNVRWVPQRATLIIFNVTTDDDDVKFVCEVTTVGGGSKVWTREIHVTVVVPSKIVHISGNQTVNEGDDVNLNCAATGNPTPAITWTRCSDNSVVQTPLTNITRQEKGGYRCTADNGVGSPATKDVFITVQYPPSIHISGNMTVNDTDTVTLHCTADGFPAPNITWTRLSDNSVIPVTFNIAGKQDEGHYRCTADNGNGNPATGDIFITVENYRPTNTRLITNLHNDIVNLTGSVNLTCSADANPPAKYRLYREQNSLISTTTGQDSFTYSTPVNERIKQVTFSCTPFNDYGDGLTKTINVTVHYNPADVTLLANTTENKDCSDSLWVNFTCVASEKANPAVGSYELYRNEKLISASDSGTWNEEITEKGKHDYSCLAIHRVKNVRSSNNVTVTFNVLSQISVYLTNGNETVQEGGNVSLYCNISGFPKPTITWSKDGEPVQNSHWLNFFDIKRDKAGNYRCHANNTCGKRDSSVKRIDVQYKPENVNLNVNITLSNDKVCADVVVNFTCTVEDANPPPHTYTLFENGSPAVQNMTSPGVWIRPLSTAGEVTYSCEARNSRGSNRSSIITFFVEVPVSITVALVHGNETLEERGDLYFNCSAPGFPGVTVSWSKVGGNTPDVRGSWFNFTRITRDEAGDYICHGNNTCGRTNSSVRSIDVLYPPLATRSGRNFTVALESSASFDCAVDGNPEPNITWYKGSTAGGTVLYHGKALNLPQTKLDDTGCYTCSASNSLGTDTITDCLKVELPPTPSTGKSSESTSKVPDHSLRVTCKVTSHNCGNVPGGNLTQTVQNLVEAQDCEVERCRPGSAIVDLILRFNRSVSESKVISTLKTAAEQDKFGIFKVDPESIKITEPEPTTRELPPTPSTGKSSEPTSKDDNKEDDLPWALIGGAAGGGVVLLIVIGVAAWHMHKKRKCRKDTKNGLVYADLGVFGRPQMPPVSTSPEALPPVKRPPAFERTQYADITDFLKGDASLPKEGNSQSIEMKTQTAPPANGNSQGNEVEPQGANKGEGGLRPKESELQVDPVFFLNLGYKAS